MIDIDKIEITYSLDSEGRRVYYKRDDAERQNNVQYPDNFIVIFYASFM
jgi:hypothetical protein